MVGKTLKKYRQKNKITQDELARWLGVSRQAISMWESGKRELKVTTLTKIARVFNVSLNEILATCKPNPLKEEMMPRQTKKKTASNKIQFSLSAPEARTVVLTGDFKSWSEKGIRLRKSKEGVWKTAVELKPGRYEYKYIVDNQWWLDPANQQTSTNSYGSQNSVIQVGA